MNKLSIMRDRAKCQNSNSLNLALLLLEVQKCQILHRAPFDTNNNFKKGGT